MRGITFDGKEMEFDGKEWKEVGQYDFKKEDDKIKVKVKKEGDESEPIQKNNCCHWGRYHGSCFSFLSAKKDKRGRFAIPVYTD